MIHTMKIFKRLNEIPYVDTGIKGWWILRWLNGDFLDPGISEWPKEELQKWSMI
jgi:hypothetical protein